MHRLLRSLVVARLPNKDDMLATTSFSHAMCANLEAMTCFGPAKQHRALMNSPVLYAFQVIVLLMTAYELWIEALDLTPLRSSPKEARQRQRSLCPRLRCLDESPV